jgi:hypothetical protein
MELVIDKWVADLAPPVVHLTGPTLHVDAGLDGQLSAPADPGPAGQPRRWEACCWA